jgi:hypothetical protein
MENSIIPGRKRGSHVGMMLSFVIFIVFLVFVLSVLQPAYESSDKNKEYLREYIKGILLEEFSADYIELTITNSSYGENILVLRGSQYGELVGDDYDWTVKTIEGEFIETTKIGEDIYFKRGEDNILRVIFSDESLKIERLEGEITSFGESEIRFVKEERYIFESKVNKTAMEYTNEYNPLKKRLDIPDSLNFGFKFEDSEKVIFETQSAPENVEVLSEQIPVQYRDIEANLKSGFITIQIW